MMLGERLLIVDKLLREAISIALEIGVFQQKKILSDSRMARQTFKEYTESPEDRHLPVSDFVKLLRIFLSYDLDSFFSENEKFEEIVNKIRELCELKEGNLPLNLRRMVFDDSHAGDRHDLEKLAGTYYVFRRHPEGAQVFASGMDISLDTRTNIGEWTNIHIKRTGDLMTVLGIIIESDAIFHFIGTVDGTSIVHSMNLLRPTTDWNELRGLVLTKTGRETIMSRVVMCRTEHNLDEMRSRCGQITIEAAKALGLSHESYLDNSCAPTGVLRAMTEDD